MNATTPTRLCACCHLASDDLQRSSVMAQALCPACRGEEPLATLLHGAPLRELGDLERLQSAHGEVMELPIVAGAGLRL